MVLPLQRYAYFQSFIQKHKKTERKLISSRAGPPLLVCRLHFRNWKFSTNEKTRTYETFHQSEKKFEVIPIDTEILCRSVYGISETDKQNIPKLNLTLPII